MARTDGRAWWILLLLGCGVLVSPLLLVDVPPLLDYPNHLARAFVLAQGDADPVLSAMYGPHWAVIPNLATDVLLHPLIRALPVHVAGRLVLGLALLLPVIGGVLYSRALFGRWSPWAAGTCLVTANGLFLLGFLNFQIGIGLAPLCAAGWLHWRERRPFGTALFGAVAAAALFFCHLTGLLFFGFLVGACQLDGAMRDGAAAAARRAWALLPAAAVAVVLYLLSPFQDEATAIIWGDPEQRLIRTLPFFGYDLWLDLASTAVVFTVIGVLAWRRFILVPRSSVFVLGGLALLALLAPEGFKGTGYVHARFAVMLAVMLFSATLPTLPRGWTARLISLALACVFLARTGQTALVWREHVADLAELRRVTASVEPGSRVLTAAVDMDEAAPGRFAFLRRQMLADGTRIDTHIAALLMIERRAFWPFLFANAAQQPLRMRQPYLAVAEQTQNIPNLRQISATGPEPGRGAAFPIAGRWPCCYDYVLVVPAGARPEFSTPALVPVARSDYAALFRAVPPP